ncbi:MAG: putative internalin [Labilithrix sp.]|nr:putative internalin [Labilithrix sp.]
MSLPIRRLFSTFVASTSTVLGVVGVVGALVLGLAGEAHAQTRPSIDVRTWRPSTDPNAGLALEPAVTPGPGVFSFGAYGSYAFRSISLRRAGSDDVAYRPLEHQLALDAVGNVGIGSRLALGIDVPLVLYQNGTGGLPSSVSERDRVPSSGIGDLGISLKGALLRNEGGGLGIAALGFVTVPTGDRDGFFGEGGPTVSARLLAEYTLLVAVAQASIGYKLRTDHRTWPAEDAGGFRFGDEIPWSIALAMKPGILGVDSGNRQRWEIAAHGWLPAGPVGPFGSGQPGSAALSPVLLGLSDRIEIGHYRDTFVTIGAEVGLTDAVGVPVIRGVLGIGWAPREHDLDHDGVRDDVDGCPEIPEDRDGYEDKDGCPEIDNDDDGVLDKEDACPNVKGEESSDPKKNGCPGVDAAPAKDSDGDGVPDARDKCPTQPEDKDGFEDEDGCPDPDNDKDGVADKDDACPMAKGEPSSDPAKNGCPESDRDGDTFDNDVDKCPDEAEVWNGVTDDEGCPDEGGKPLVTIDDKRAVRLASPLQIVGPTAQPDVDPASVPTVRALAQELNKHRDWTLAIGVKPGAGDNAQMDALARSFAVVRVLGTYARRDGVAESIGWDAVKARPGAESGMGLLILSSTPVGPPVAPAKAP